MTTTDRVVAYRAPDGWRWQYRAAGNHRVLADGGQAYSRKADAIAGAKRVTHCALVDPGHPDVGRAWVLPLVVTG